MAAKRILVVDPRTAGISGDMMVAALLDAGADTAAVVNAMTSPANILSGCDDISIEVADVDRGGIHARHVAVAVREEYDHRAPNDLLEAAASCIQRLRLSDPAARFVLDSLNALISAEATVHGRTPRDLELHETGSADTLADVIGAAAGLDALGAFADTAVYATPVAVGGGATNFSHGAVSCPAPATLEILRTHRLFFLGGPVECELATPTGAALLAALTPTPVASYPPMKPTHVGYGAGTRQFPEMPNVLRLTFGEPVSLGLASDDVWVIETNIDDATGEAIGYAVQQLLKAGARDAIAIPMSTKKSRPGHILQVIADASNVEHLSSAVIALTGSLGVRIRPSERRILLREFTAVRVPLGDTVHEIRIKIARDTNGHVLRIKPEYDDLATAAELAGRPLREVEDKATRQAAELLAAPKTDEAL
jgi:uncharacterized protein (TIGR00299 family) protein